MFSECGQNVVVFHHNVLVGKIELRNCSPHSATQYKCTNTVNTDKSSVLCIDVAQAFNDVDSNHDGRIDATQLLEVAKLIGIKVKSVHHAEALITKYGSRGWLLWSYGPGTLFCIDLQIFSLRYVFLIRFYKALCRMRTVTYGCLLYTSPSPRD